jgi:tetratricopeptide (TPR) repeat protein
MDCDDVVLMLARDATTVSDTEADALDAHLAGCETCFALMRERMSIPLQLRPVDPEHFEIGEVIAEGGMGKITRAFDRRLGRTVALKEVLSSELRARFEREAMITARLQHPAIVPIYEAGTWPDGTAFYTMRLVPGETLGDALVRRDTLPARLALLPHVIAVTEALAYAHSRGVIHRDLKPQNILIGEFGETVVIDWGLAKERDAIDVSAGLTEASAPQLTKVGSVVGTPCFMAPEQARGEDIDERADVFALGALLYNVIVGAPPYWDRSHDSQQLIDAVLARPPTPLAKLAPSTPADLAAIVEHAMAREPADRFPNAGAFADELHRFANGQLLRSREYRMRDLLGRWVRKYKTLVALGAAAFVALAIVGIVAVRNMLRAREAERAAATAFSRGQQRLCATSIPQLASPWTDDARALVHRKFQSTQLPYAPQTIERVDAGFARWSLNLEAAKQRICEQPTPELAAQLDCLAERTREARALISQFHDADKATVMNAIGATEQLAPIERCTAPSRTKPVAATPAVATVRDLFARSHALLEVGKSKDALPLTEQAVTAADAIGDPAIRAAARVAHGAALSGTGEYDKATVMLQTALQLAEAGHDDRSRAQAWTNIVRIEYLRGRFERAAFLREAALGAAKRIDDVFLETEIMLFLGGALGQLGKNAEAQALFEEAVALRKKAYGDRDRRVANALSALGNAHAMKGNLDQGIAAHREAAAIAEAALGNAHPSVGSMHGNLGSDYAYGLRSAEAIAEFEISLRIAESVYGPKHRDVAVALTNLGTARHFAGQHAEALELLTRAEAMWRDVNPKHPALAEVLVGRYLAQQALGKPTNLADLETALELAKGLPPFIRARVQLVLGKASKPPRSTELVKAAAEGFATSTLPLSQRELADAKAWLAAHP